MNVFFCARENASKTEFDATFFFLSPSAGLIYVYLLSAACLQADEMEKRGSHGAVKMHRVQCSVFVVESVCLR